MRLSGSIGHDTVGHQLKILKQAKLLSFQGQVCQIIYELSDEHVRIIIHCFQGEHIEERYLRGDIML